MTHFQDIVWPKEEVARSRTEARERERKRKARQRAEWRLVILTSVVIGAYIYVLLWAVWK